MLYICIPHTKSQQEPVSLAQSASANLIAQESTIAQHSQEWFIEVQETTGGLKGRESLWGNNKEFVRHGE